MATSYHCILISMMSLGTIPNLPGEIKVTVIKSYDNHILVDEEILLSWIAPGGKLHLLKKMPKIRYHGGDPVALTNELSSMIKAIIVKEEAEKEREEYEECPCGHSECCGCDSDCDQYE